jgi:hypothetical protein
VDKYKIITTKFLCRNGSSKLSGGAWQDRFNEDKWYDGEYETWGWQDGYRINGGWRRYWVVNEQGEKESLSKTEFNSIFEKDIQELRNRKLQDLGF